MTSAPSAYGASQIALHWFVAVGILVQIAIHEPIVRETTAQYAGEAPGPADATLASAHGLIGTMIFAAVLVRLWLRYRNGAPSHAPGISIVQAKIASLIHNALYALLICVGITGMITRWGAVNLGNLHFYLNAAMVALIFLHAGAALFNQYVRKDGTLSRMIPGLRS